MTSLMVQLELSMFVSIREFFFQDYSIRFKVVMEFRMFLDFEFWKYIIFYLNLLKDSFKNVARFFWFRYSCRFLREFFGALRNYLQDSLRLF